MLQQLSNVPEKKTPDPPPRTCEACGYVVDIGHFAINFMFVVGSPGHPSMKPFQCPFEEHWACSITCWEQVAHACITEHGKEMLLALHAPKGETDVNSSHEI